MDDVLATWRLHHKLAFHLLDTICNQPDGITGHQVADILQLSSTKGIGPRLNALRETLGQTAINPEEAIRKVTRRKQTLWLPGPRILQARYALYLEVKQTEPGELADPDLTALAPENPGTPTIVIRGLMHQRYYASFEDGLDHIRDFIAGNEGDFDTDLDDESPTIGEIFIHRIEPGDDQPPLDVPPSYEENGIYSRGDYDYASPHVISNFGTAWNTYVSAVVGRARWVERRIRLTRHPLDHYNAVRIRHTPYQPEAFFAFWKPVDAHLSYRYLNWFGVRGVHGHRSAPPLDLRLRCWHTATLQSADGKRRTVNLEALRGDTARTARRAIALWHQRHPGNENKHLDMTDLRIAKSQPRPTSPLPDTT